MEVEASGSSGFLIVWDPRKQCSLQLEFRNSYSSALSFSFPWVRHLRRKKKNFFPFSVLLPIPFLCNQTGVTEFCSMLQSDTLYSVNID